jgi:hypothetical protein
MQFSLSDTFRKASRVYKSHDSSVGVATRPRILGFDSQRKPGIFLFTIAYRTDLGPTQPPIQWVRRDLYLRVKRPRREADHSPPSSAEVKECVELYLHSPNTSYGTGVTLPLPSKCLWFDLKVGVKVTPELLPTKPLHPQPKSLQTALVEVQICRLV